MQVFYKVTKMPVYCSTVNKKKELFLYVCALQSELGHQGSKGSNCIGLNRVSPYILTSVYGVCGSHWTPSSP